jgi:hypothetical protein
MSVQVLKVYYVVCRYAKMGRSTYLALCFHHFPVSTPSKTTTCLPTLVSLSLLLAIFTISCVFLADEVSPASYKKSGRKVV